MSNEIMTYWTKDNIGDRLVLFDGKITFQSCALADMSKRTEAIWTAALNDRYLRHIEGRTQLDGVFKLAADKFQVAG